MIKYYIGEEKNVIEEHEGFGTSIFHEQYKQAVKLIGQMMKNPHSEVPNLIAFCGDRGEGKTSCMMSVSYIIGHANDDKVKGYLKDISGYDLAQKKLEMLPVIDPAFFDKHHNVLELLLGQMYGTYKAWQKEHKEKSGGNYYCMKEVTKLFQNVKFCLRQIDPETQELYDPLEELEQLSAGIDLQKYMSKLISGYLELVEKDFLVVRIDDIDLNMSLAYRMCEELRKYLISDKCLVMISVKTEQLLVAIENAMHREASYPESLDISAMASKYVDKLIPMSCRINMPKTYSLCDQGLKVYGKYPSDEVIFDMPSIKEGVVRKIFYNTRYLFYNSKGSVSPIIPNNLRSLMHLLGLLFSMEEPQGGEDTYQATLNENKNTFKVYFYHSWTRQLTAHYKENALELVSMEDSGEVNKFVLNSLKDLYKDEEAQLLKDITESTNYNYNISIGDVLYVITSLDQQTVDKQIKLYLFFIRSYYSIKLYETYDVITSGKEYVYPKANDDGQLLKYDAWFDRVNALQKLVAGSYFTYEPGTIIAPDGRTEPRDYKVISGSSGTLTKMIMALDNLKGHYQELEDNDREIFDLAFNLAEYFILSISRSIYERDRDNYTKSTRKSPVPNYLTIYNQSTGYYVFDVLGIFYSIINMEYAYDRFDSICTGNNEQGRNRESLFGFAKRHEHSLLRKMIEAVKAKCIREEIITKEYERMYPMDSEDGFFFWQHRLLSNAVIRNAEVATAMFETIKNCRYTLRSSSDSNKLLAGFYTNIKKTNMATYTKGENNVAYSLVFDFLEPIITLLNNNNILTKMEITCGGKVYKLPDFVTLFSSGKKPTMSTDEKNKRKKELGELFKKTTIKKWPVLGKTIKKKIKENDIELYNHIQEEDWETILADNEKYSKTDLLAALLSYYDLFSYLIAARKNQNDIPADAPVVPGQAQAQPEDIQPAQAVPDTQDEAEVQRQDGNEDAPN